MAALNNMRIVADNACRRATLTASSSAGQLLASNLQVDDKSVLWRATDTSATLNLGWPALEKLSCVVFPFCNFSPTTTIRVRGYSDAAATVQVLDTGPQLACPAPAVSLVGYTAAQAASAYAYGGGAYGRIWFAAVSVRCIVIDLVDANNLQGYLEAACLVTGAYWSPAYNASNPSVTPVDTTNLYRTDAGNQGAESGYTYDQLSLDLSYVPPTDRTALVNILRGSRAYPVLVSLYPASTDLELERDHMVYGRRSKDSKVGLQAALLYGASIELEEI